MPSTKILSELLGNKRWAIRGYEVEAYALKDALLSNVTDAECLAWKMVEPDDDAEFDFHRTECPGATDHEIWHMVGVGREVLWSDVQADMKSARDDEAILQVLGLTWDDVKIVAICCQIAGCDELLDVDESACPECGSQWCEIHRPDPEDVCWSCGHEWTAVDFLKLALDT